MKHLFVMYPGSVEWKIENDSIVIRVEYYPSLNFSQISPLFQSKPQAVFCCYQGVVSGKL